MTHLIPLALNRLCHLRKVLSPLDIASAFGSRDICYSSPVPESMSRFEILVSFPLSLPIWPCVPTFIPHYPPGRALFFTLWLEEMGTSVTLCNLHPLDKRDFFPGWTLPVTNPVSPCRWRDLLDEEASFRYRSPPEPSPNFRLKGISVGNKILLCPQTVVIWSRFVPFTFSYPLKS